MSIKTDQDKLKERLVFEEDLFNKALDRFGKPEFIQERVAHTTSGLASNLGVMNIALGNYKEARGYFLKSFEHEEEWVKLTEGDPGYDSKGKWSNFYSQVLEYLQYAVLTLNTDIINKAAKKFDLSTPVDEWPKTSRPYYAIDKALASLILDETSELEKIKKQNKDMQRKADVDGILAAIWAIEKKSLPVLVDAFKTIIASESHSNSANFANVSRIATVLLILARIKGMDLKDFDPPYVDMNYVKLAQNY